MSIAPSFNSQDAPTRTIELREGPEHFPDEDYSALPYGDAQPSLEAYQAYDEGYLAEAPWALEAYLTQDHLMKSPDNMTRYGGKIQC